MTEHNITLEQVIEVCGDYTSRKGTQYNFQCPICSLHGGDNHKDNLSYNSKKKIITCFADKSHTLDVLNMINHNIKKERETDKIIRANKTPLWEEKQEEFLTYMSDCNYNLLNNKKLLNVLYLKRGLRKDTIDLLNIGYDSKTNNFVFPIVSLKYGKVINFEFRKNSDKKIIRRIKDVDSKTIAQIYGLKKSDVLYIVEGFIDAAILTQFLLEMKKDNFTVYSCSAGAASLFDCMTEINFSNFKTTKLILDNDKEGDKQTEKILKEYPFIIDSRKFLIDSNCKDINEWYLKRKECLK